MRPSDFREKLLTVLIVVGATALVAGAIYVYERYYRGPDDSFFVGTWRGELGCLGENRTGYRFKSDHTYEGRDMMGDTESWYPGGKWFAGGDFLYLRARYDDASGPYDKLEIWHIDSMTPVELRMHFEDLPVVLKRTE